MNVFYFISSLTILSFLYRSGIKMKGLRYRQKNDHSDMVVAVRNDNNVYVKLNQSQTVLV